MPSIIANLAANINAKQTDNFYFTILFASDQGTIDADSFTLANVEITGTTDFTVANAFKLLYPVESNFAVIAVDLPDNVQGDFVLGLTGTVTIGGTDYDIAAPNKFIEYDTVGSRSGDTYDITPPSSELSEIKVKVSTRSIRNGGIIIAQFDFNIGVPYFTSDYFNVSAGATKSTAEVIDDYFRTWIALVTVPSSGSGEVEISVPDDAFNFDYDAIRLPVQHSENPGLTITEPLDADGNPTIQPVKGMTFERIFTVMGNNVNGAEISGLLREEFYHHWDESTGKLYLRSKGVLEEDYDDFEIYVFARDDGGMDGLSRTLDYQSTLTSPVPLAPMIVQPADTLEFFYGEYNEVQIEILRIDTVSASDLSVEGAYLGMGYQKNDTGVSVFGDIPARGKGMGQGIPGFNAGKLVINAKSQQGASPEVTAPWAIFNKIPPQFSAVSFAALYLVNGSLTETIEVDADPEPTIVVESGALPTGITMDIARTDTKTTISFSGTLTAAGTFNFKLKATNSLGSVVSSQYTIAVFTGTSAPSIAKRFPTGQWFTTRGALPLNLLTYFNVGIPAATFSFVVSNVRGGRLSAQDITDKLEITAANVLRRTSSLPISTIFDLTVTASNGVGSDAVQTATVYILN